MNISTTLIEVLFMFLTTRSIKLNPFFSMCPKLSVVPKIRKYGKNCQKFKSYSTRKSKQI